MGDHNEATKPEPPEEVFIVVAAGGELVAYRYTAHALEDWGMDYEPVRYVPAALPDGPPLPCTEAQLQYLRHRVDLGQRPSRGQTRDLLDHVDNLVAKLKAAEAEVDGLTEVLRAVIAEMEADHDGS